MLPWFALTCSRFSIRGRINNRDLTFSLREHTDIRAKLVKNHTLEDMSEDVQELKRRLIAAGGADTFRDISDGDENGIRTVPSWALQPYIRPAKPAPGECPPVAKEKETKVVPKEKKHANEAAHAVDRPPKKRTK